MMMLKIFVILTEDENMFDLTSLIIFGLRGYLPSLLYFTVVKRDHPLEL
jgi:hypothetical protein